MLKKLYRLLRATAFGAALLMFPALAVYGVLHGWGLANYMAGGGIGALAALMLLVVALGDKVGPGYGGPAISGDEVGRPSG